MESMQHLKARSLFDSKNMYKFRAPGQAERSQTVHHASEWVAIRKMYFRGVKQWRVLQHSNYGLFTQDRCAKILWLWCSTDCIRDPGLGLGHRSGVHVPTFRVQPAPRQQKRHILSTEMLT